MRRDLRCIGLAVTWLLTLNAVGIVRADTAPVVSEQFSVRHTPAPAMARVQVDSGSGMPRYIWNFCTEIRNGHPFPLRIVRFAFELTGPDGRPLPDSNGRVFSAKEFTEWYTVGDPVRDGWLGPGQAAADTANWNRSPLPIPPRGRWYYVAVDSSGAEYRAEAPVDLYPSRPAGEPWAQAPTAGRIPVTLDLAWPGGAAPALSQLRFDRLASDPRLPPPAVYAWEGAAVPRLEAAVPGLYKVTYYASGCEPVSETVLLEEADGPLLLTLRPAALGGATSTAGVDPGHAWIEDAWLLQRHVADELAAYLAAWGAYEAAHGGQEGFIFDWAPLQAELVTAMTASSQEAMRRFAAWLTASKGPVADVEAAEHILELLPPSSPVWATQPDAALRAAFDCGRLLGRDLLDAFAQESPDRFVRGEVVAAQALAAWERGDTVALAVLRARLNGEFADLRLLDRQRARIANNAKIVAGQSAPAFRVRDLDSGAELTTADFAGRWLLVHFWASWCGPCKHEMPAVHAAVDAYRGRGLDIISFSLDRKLEDVATYRAGAWKLPWKQAWLAGGTEDEVARAFEVQGIPRLVLIDRAGRIVATDQELRGGALDVTLAKWLADN
jgi:thiol-disulfide isomerase/thioredoxin